MVTRRKGRNLEYVLNFSYPYKKIHACVVTCPRIGLWLLLSGSEWIGKIVLSSIITLSKSWEVSGISLALITVRFLISVLKSKVSQKHNYFIV
jgi:hypothetical protein